MAVMYTVIEGSALFQVSFSAHEATTLSRQYKSHRTASFELIRPPAKYHNLNFLFNYIVSSVNMLYEPFTRSSTPSSFTFSSKPPTREPSPVFSESNRISSLPSPPPRSPTPEECGTPPERHADYYLDDELVIFRVSPQDPCRGALVC